MMGSIQKENKTTSLLLNTPGACFLCLQDNQGDGPVEHLNGGIVNLSNICRYLNINQCSLLSTSLKDPGGTITDLEENLKQNLCKFSVNLCPQCLELTDKLNKMLIQLEKAKLMVNYHLLSFHKALEGTEKWEESLEWINLLGRMHANPTNSFEAKLVQLLREETGNKSFKMLRKAEQDMPQILLPKCIAPPPPPPPEKLSYHPPQSPPPTPSITLGTSTSLKTLLSQLVTSSALPSKLPIKSKQYRCPYCTKIMSHSKCSVHLACLHVDKLLSSYFPPSMPPSEEICRQVYSTHVIEKAVKTASSTPTAPRLGCHLCGITYSGSFHLKQHFLVSHTDKLCEEIKKFQLNPQKNMSKPIKIKSTTKRTTTPSKKPEEPVDLFIKDLQEKSLIENDLETCSLKRYQCSFCDSQIIKSREFSRHLSSCHPDKILAHFLPPTESHLDKLIDDNPNHFRLLCRKVLASQMTRAAVAPSVEGPSSTTSVCCHLCSRTCCDRRNLKHHLIVDHTTLICEQLVKMKNVKIDIQDKKKKRMEKKSCAVCSLTFYQVDKLRRHEARQHPDQLFLKCKPGGMGEEEFRGICNEVFEGEVRQATYGKPGNKIYKCGYCSSGKRRGRDFKGQIELRVHLVFQHGREMERKLGDKLEEVEEVEEMEEMEEETGCDFGRDEMVEEEEDEGEFDMEPDIELLNEMLYPETVLNEDVSEEEEECNGDDINS